MTRNQCPKCKMALLRDDSGKSSSLASGKALFNSDGTLNMASLDSKRNTREECVVCPMEEFRRSIARKMCKRVMAAKLLSGMEVGDASALCVSCQSPCIKTSAGDAMECQVCPVLDEACVGVAREE